MQNTRKQRGRTSPRVERLALQLLHALRGNSPTAVRMSKEVFYRGLDAPLDFPATARALNDEYVREIMLTDDAAEGARAFVEKRVPNWTDS